MNVRLFSEADGEGVRSLASSLSAAGIDAREAPWSEIGSDGGLRIVCSMPHGESDRRALIAAAKNGLPMVLLCSVPSWLGDTPIDVWKSMDTANELTALFSSLIASGSLPKDEIARLLDATKCRILLTDKGGRVLECIPDPTQSDYREFLDEAQRLIRSMENGEHDGIICSQRGFERMLSLGKGGSGGAAYLLASVESGGETEIEALKRDFERQTRELRNAVSQLEKRNTQMLREITLASELQQSLLPKEFPNDAPFEIARKYIPLSTIGGDFFDVLKVSPDTLGIIIADVSGHGVAPAFITAMFKSAFSHFAPGESSPAKVLTRLNQEFARIIRTEHYLTAFYAIIDCSSLTCTFCSAGHPNQLLIREGGVYYELATPGFLIGMFESTAYEDRSIQLKQGDVLCFFTDGLVETKGAGGKPFGRAGILESFRRHGHLQLVEFTDRLVGDLIQYMEGPALEDDITFLALKAIESLDSA
jgi:serine phosphatase RsbU (regulator of sigma subunit)